jgi:hypothetical protein
MPGDTAVDALSPNAQGCEPLLMRLVAIGLAFQLLGTFTTAAQHASAEESTQHERVSPPPPRVTWFEFTQVEHHSDGVSGYELGVRRPNDANWLRIIALGKPPADPDGLVRVNLRRALASLPSGVYEVSVRSVGAIPQLSSPWTDPLTTRHEYCGEPPCES